MLLGILKLFQWSIIVKDCSNFITESSCLILANIYVVLHVHNVHNAYMYKLQMELSPVNLAMATCDSCRGMTSKKVAGSLFVTWGQVQPALWKVPESAAHRQNGPERAGGD